MAKKAARKTTGAKATTATADVKSQILTELVKDLVGAQTAPSGYDRTPTIHDRYTKAGVARGETVTPATRRRGTKG